jgi:threonine dehydratase
VRWEGTDVWLKDETQQVSGSFKFRGNINVVLKNPQAHFITASTGNHAAGLAWASKLMGAKARVVLPLSTPQVKQDRIQEAGAHVIFHGENYDEARLHALSLALKDDEVYVPSFDSKLIVLGHAPLFHESLEQGPDSFDLTLVPVGGGGLLTSALLSLVSPVVGIELASAPAMYESVKAGRRVRIKVPSETGAEGLLVPEVGRLPFSVARTRKCPVILVSPDELRLAMRWCWDQARVCVEGAGAASVAGLLRLLRELPPADRPKRVLCVLSGGNIGKDVWQKSVGEWTGGGVVACEASG